ncbi:MAG: flagellar filament capping protein FliD [Chromatiales bacterium]|nr:flagellar filament capping protein FliD [Chromatiales bacterium]
MAGIASLGVGSGLDLNSLVQGLLAAERDPVVNRLDRQEAKLQAQLSAYGSLRSGLSGLQDALTALGEVGTGRTASSSNTQALSVKADDTAPTGTYSVQITELAEAASLASGGFADPADVAGAGSLTLDFGDGRSETLDFTDANTSFESIRDAINDADIGVNAVIVNDGSSYRLMLTSTETGLDNAVSASVSGFTDAGMTGGFTVATAAKDAQLSVNGLAVTSATNTVSDVIPGVTLTLKDKTDGTAAAVTVSLNKGAVSSAVDKFVKAYNELSDQLGKLTNYNADTGQAAILVGDSTARGLQSRLSGALIGRVESTSQAFDNLVELGITTGADGKLKFDSTALGTALDEDFAGVVDLVNNFATGLEEQVGSYLGDEGLLNARTDGIQARIDDIGEQRVQLDYRLQQIEARYVKQFTALDTLVAQLNQTSTYLTSQLANIPVPGQSRK